MVKLEVLKELASQAGLSLMGATNASELSIDKERLSEWQKEGNAAAMTYMSRDPELLSNPLRLLPEAKSILSFALRYDSSPHPERPHGFGKVARYAWGRDYHKVLPKLMKDFLALVNTRLRIAPIARIFSDAVPLLERAVAARSGYGFIGKNTLFISPGTGSFTLLGEILWDQEVEKEEASSSGCGTCTKCLSDCPTGALTEKKLDARKCISYLTIEKKGVLNADEGLKIADWLFGCDICQEVCPYNYTAIKTRRIAAHPQLGKRHGVGALLSLREVLEVRTDAEYIQRFAGTALMRAKREGLVRNACVVAVNTRCFELSDVLGKISAEDESPVVRAQALYSYSQLTSGRKANLALNSALRDCDSVKKIAMKVLEERW